MDGDDQRPSLSRREHSLLARELRDPSGAEDEGVDANTVRISDLDDVFTEEFDSNLLTITSPPRPDKRRRIDPSDSTEDNQPTHSSQDLPSCSHLMEISVHNVQDGHESHGEQLQEPSSSPLQPVPHHKSTFFNPENVFMQDLFDDRTAEPAATHDISFPSSSPHPLSPLVPDDDNDDKCSFGPDYFWNYNSDEETSYTVDAADWITLQMSDREPTDYGESAQESTTKNVSQEPLYDGAPISQSESFASILSFVQSEHLSGAGLSRLLSLINLHLPKPNKFLKSKARLIKVLGGFDDPIHTHYFCNICYKIRQGPSDKCDSCTDEAKGVQFFITIPLVPQLQRLFARPQFVEDLKYKEKRVKSNQANIEDIYDGAVYKEAERHFSASCTNITLMWNTDGMQVFNSNSYSLWPFYLVINELSPEKRFLSENLLIAGLWGSVVKPHPNLYLLPIYRDLKCLQTGIQVVCHGDEEATNVKATVICGTCDAPARACFMNLKHHAGFYSCPVCLIKGVKPGDATVFPYEEQTPVRTLPQYEEHVRFAVQHRVIVTNSVHNVDQWCGVKGPTVLKDIVPNFFPSMAIDVMHCIYLGVVRQMLHLWVDKDRKNEEYSIYNKIKIVNGRLQQLSPPHYMERSPQSLDKLIYWKATELRSFLFNCSLSVLFDVLQPQFFNHFALLVKGVALLNSSSISEEDLLLSSLLLNQFVSQFSQLYKVDNMSHNVHMVIHLAQCVRFLGPLWSTSCFKFEDINGRLSNLIHGTRHVELQIYSNLSIITKLPLIVQGLHEGLAKDFCMEILKKRYSLKIKEKISQGLYCVGVFRNVSARYSWVTDGLERQGLLLNTSHVQIFSRVLKRGILYVSKFYNRGKRISSYVKYFKDNCVYYGNIECFVRVSCTCSGACNCATKHFAVIKRKQVLPLEIQGIEMTHIMLHHCDENCENVLDCDIVNLSDLVSLLFKIKTPDNIYLCDPLNHFECE